MGFLDAYYRRFDRRQRTLAQSIVLVVLLVLAAYTGLVSPEFALLVVVGLYGALRISGAF